jgi:hypothetical protein
LGWSVVLIVVGSPGGKGPHSFGTGPRTYGGDKKRQVIRYYIIATAIVVVFGGIVFAHRLAPPNLQISAQPTGTPTVETHHAEAPATARPFTGQGPWVLSALPACFDEQSRVSGPAAAVRAKLPPAGDRIAPGTTLQVGSCTLVVRARDIWVDRGPDRLRVPPEAALYRVDGHLVLTARSGGQLEIRRY